MSDLITCYRYHQKTQRWDVPVSVQDWGGRARFSLMLARADVAAGTDRYIPYSPGRYEGQFSAFGESHMRWLENPAGAGLRFVGFADELSPYIAHNGWYTDREMQHGAVRGIVYRMPTRHGCPKFVYGFADPENEGAVCLCFDAADDEQYAAKCADDIAERMAEQESEYQEAWRAGRSYDEAGDTIGETRRATLALIKEIKAICPSPATYPETYAALREGVMSALAEIRTLRERRTDWLDTYGNHPGFME